MGLLLAREGGLSSANIHFIGSVESTNAYDALTASGAYGVAATEAVYPAVGQLNIYAAMVAASGGYVASSGPYGQSQTFLANVTGQIQSIALRGYRDTSAAGVPAQLGRIALFSLTANSVAGLPQTQLAAITFNLMTLSTTPGLITFDFSQVSGATVTAGTWYAAVWCHGSDWGSNNSNQTMGYFDASGNVSPSISTSGYTAAASYPTGWAADTWSYDIEVVVTGSTPGAVDAEAGTFSTTVAMTESATAADSPVGSFLDGVFSFELSTNPTWDGKTVLHNHLSTSSGTVSNDSVAIGCPGSFAYSATQTLFGLQNSAWQKYTGGSWSFGNIGIYTGAQSLLPQTSLPIWTVELWYFRNAVQPTAGGNDAFYIYWAGYVPQYIRFDGLNVTVRLGASALTVTAPAISINGWHHIAVQNDGTTIIFFLDGVPTVVSSTDGSLNPFALNTFDVFGQDNDTGVIHNTYTQEFRLSNCAIYSNSGFTPPTAAFADPILSTDVTASPITAAIPEAATATDSLPKPTGITGVVQTEATGGTLEASDAFNGGYQEEHLTLVDSVTSLATANGAQMEPLGDPAIALYCNFEGGVWDLAGNGSQALAGAATIQNSIVKFGSYALSFGSAGNAYQYTPLANHTETIPVWTYECWYYPATTSSYWFYFFYPGNGIGGFNLVSATSTYGTGLFVGVGVGSFALNNAAWNHLCLQFDGTTLCFFVNGTAVTLTNNTGAGKFALNLTPCVNWAWYTGPSGNAAYLDEVILTRAAKYSNSGFTPPTTPLSYYAASDTMAAPVQGGLTEAATGADVVATPNTSWNPTQTEAAAAADPQGAMGGAENQLEAVMGADAVAVLSTYGVVDSESISLSDVSVGGVPFAVTDTEATTGSDNGAVTASSPHWILERGTPDANTYLLYHCADGSSACGGPAFSGTFGSTHTTLGFATSLTLPGYGLIYFPVTQTLPAPANLGKIWTIEFWVYTTVTFNAIVMETSTGASAMLQVTSGASSSIYTGSSGSYFTAPAISTNAWHHIAVQCDGTSAYFFLDGSPTLVGTNVAAHDYDLSGSASVFGLVNADGMNTIYVQEFRVSTIARYANSGFTSPTVPFTVVGAADAGDGKLPTSCYLPETMSNNALASSLAYGNGAPYVKYLDSASTIYGYGVTFIASVTAHLGPVTAYVYKNNHSNPPAQPGTVELWQLASNSISAMPSTKLASLTFTQASAPTSGLFCVDFTAVSGANVTAGVGYAVVFYRGSDWTGTNDQFALLAQYWGMPSPMAVIWNQNGVAWYAESNYSPGILVEYVTPQDAANGIGGLTLVSITEALAGVDASDYNAGMNANEAAACSDSASTIVTFYGDQSNSVHGPVQHDYTQLISRVGSSDYWIGGDGRSGHTFQATASGQLGAVLFCMRQGWGLVTPTATGSIELWVTAGGGPSGIPTTQIASVPLPWSSLTTTDTWYSFDFTMVGGAVLSSGTWYYICIHTGSDWDGANNHLVAVLCNTGGIASSATTEYGGTTTATDGGSWSTYGNDWMMIVQMAGNADTLMGNWVTTVWGAEAATGTDSPAGGYTVAMPEAATSTDGLISTAIVPMVGLEPATGADVPVGAFVSPQAIAEIGTGTDVKDSTCVTGATEIESAAGSDVPAATAILVGTESEAASSVDSPVSVFAFGVADTETAAGGDAPVVSASFASTLSESGALADTTDGVGPESATITEPTTAADASSTSGVQPASIPEGATAADAPVSTFVTSAVESEAATGADAPVGANATAAAGLEATSGTDLPIGQNVTSSAGTEAASASDAATGGNVAVASIAESATAADVLAAAALFVGARAEAASSAEAIIAAAAFVSAMSETVSGADAETVTALLVSAITEAVAAGDATDGVGPQGVTVSEVAAGSDIQVAAAGFIAAATAAMAALDAADAANAGGNAPQSEMATAMDAPAALALFVAALTEAATGADVPTATAVFVADTAGAATATELAGVAAAFVGAAVENASGVDTVSAFWVAYASLTEASTVADAIALMGLFVGAVAEASIGADIEGAWTGVTRAMAEALTGIDTGSATMAGAGQQLEVGVSSDLPAGVGTVPVLETESVAGTDGTAAVFASPQAIEEVSVASDGKAGQLAAVGASNELALAADVGASTMAAVASTGELTSAVDGSAGAVAFTLVMAESALAGDGGTATFSAVAAALEAIAGVDWPAAALSAAADLVVSVTAADWLGAATVANAEAAEAVVALEETGGEAGQWVGIYEVVSATESGIVELARLAFGLEDVSTTDLVLANVNFHVGTVEYVVAVDLWTGVLWVFDHRFVVSGAGRSFSVQRGGISPVAMGPRHFEVTEAGTT